MRKNYMLNLVEPLMEEFEEDSIRKILECFLEEYLSEEDISELIEHYHSEDYEYYASNFGYRGMRY